MPNQTVVRIISLRTISSDFKRLVLEKLLRHELSMIHNLSASSTTWLRCLPELAPESSGSKDHDAVMVVRARMFENQKGTEAVPRCLVFYC